MSYYISTNTNKVSFENLAQTKSINISTNGIVQVRSKPIWVRDIEILNQSITARSITDGKSNTDAINSFETTEPNAASTCVDYRYGTYTNIDWYLPAKNELLELISNNDNLGVFKLPANVAYWTSTETSSTRAFQLLVNPDNTASEDDSDKVVFSNVRPITKIKYTGISPYSVGEDVGYGIVFSIDINNKLVYIVSKETINHVKWGIRDESVNILTTTGANISVLKTQRYIENVGELVLEVQQDNNIYTTIALSQAPSDTDSQKVLLKDIVDNIMFQACNENSLLSGMRKFDALFLAKRILQELEYDTAKEPRVYETYITEAKTIIPPIDYVDYIRLSIVGQDGILRPLFVNNKINTSYQYIQDHENDIIFDDLGYPIKTDGTRVSNTDRQWTFNSNGSECYNQGGCLTYFYPGYIGGQKSYTGSYKWNADTREFILDGIPSDITTVVLEYVSDPLLAEKDPAKLRVHKFLQSTIEAGIYYMYIDKMRNVPRVEKEAARREYYNERRKASIRINIKANEIRQKLNANMGGMKINNVF